MRKKIQQHLPLILLGASFLILLIFVFLKANDYGMTWDEPVQDAYGTFVYQWYRSHGQDIMFLQLSNLRYYGPFFEFIVSFFQHIPLLTAHYWHVRAVITGFAGVMGIGAVAACAFELGQPWLAVISTFLLSLYPRYIGDIFHNSKDIPFAAFYCLTLWAILHLINNWNKKYTWIYSSLLVSIILGMTMAIRVIGVIWWGILPIIAAFGWIGMRRISKKKRKNAMITLARKQIISFLIIYPISFVVMTVLWPYILMDPFANFWASLTLMSHFAVSSSATMLFLGHLVSQTQPPRDYTLVWIAVGTPLFTLFCIISGLISWIHGWIKQNGNAMLGIVFLSFFLPLIAIITLDSTLYNALRQFLFVIPPLIIFAAFGFVSLFQYLNKYKLLIYSGIIICIISVISIATTMMTLHPYEYIYANSLTGGLPGEDTHFETDYWATSFIGCGKWLANHYQQYVTTQYPTVFPRITDAIVLTRYLPPNFKVIQDNPDFYVTLVQHDAYNQGAIFPRYKVIYQEKRYGVALCEVKTRP